ncbi:hypothetical protein HYPBUDRAFT_155579 [Hyphopichia burtonii NRRL Y-1933]|uniref:Calcipressin-domain-containing protein n=1 Tax=Hyphopichia burtonii NRRL Y-1933 TaxID=984485 RepID=A0A1E4RMI1_9ASCO|nr:hypothetical protein HYPBUDRAFT_155579 [Hyphopichia burtonii NRRL Y-1933]ODV68472.1 hypothetical protein HYPBUDRAFT_155579 [Hyphopichia burtonii NRRL Y-1933]
MSLDESKTTVIISNLSKEDFISNELAFVDRIKLSILNLKPPIANEYGDDYYLNNIQHWSNLSSLNRIIIIFKTNEAALNIYNYLLDNLNGKLSNLPFNSETKISLQENLLVRSKSFDSLINHNDSLSVTKDLSNFKNFHNKTNYNEPEPNKFDAYNDLSKLGIDLNTFNDLDQLDELKSPNNLKRNKSLTKTLFKPKLDNLNTKFDPNDNPPPQSPTITLDETF